MNTSHIQSVTAFVRPYYRNHDLTNAYYREAIRRHLDITGGYYFEKSVSRLPFILRFMEKMRNSYQLHRIMLNSRLFYRLIDSFAHRIEGPIKTPSSLFCGSVGQYFFRTSKNNEYKICIDSWDSGEIESQDLLKWCDIYFKTNFWSSIKYPKKVLPLINGNPFVLKNLSILQSFRSMKKQYDLCCIVRAWGGTKEVNGLEHNIKLIEAISKANGKKFILAYLVGGNVHETARRLDRLKIPWTTKPMPLHKLWRISAQSHINMIRLGMFYCTPWRLIDMLAMGACPVLDRSPYTIWPQPLKENTNFFSLNIDVGPWQPIAPDEQYAKIPVELEKLLSDGKNIDRISNNNTQYFDHYVDPQKLGKYIIQTVENKLEHDEPLLVTDHDE